MIARYIRPLCLLGMLGCAAPNEQLGERLDLSEMQTREELAALKGAAESSYDRERAMAERLQLVEEQNVDLESRVLRLESELEALQQAPAAAPPPIVQRSAPAPAMGGGFDAMETYRQALDLYRMRQYDAALERFGRIVAEAPDSPRADNAQYWMGECHYGLGRFRPALAEFTKVFAYRKTEKADDAQLKIARCYLNLGAAEQAVSAFQKLVDDYPDSEYVTAAQKEMGYLQGP